MSAIVAMVSMENPTCDPSTGRFRNLRENAKPTATVDLVRLPTPCDQRPAILFGQTNKLTDNSFFFMVHRVAQ